MIETTLNLLVAFGVGFLLWFHEIQKMGRGKGKGKKHSAASGHENSGSGEEEKIHVRRRGRPQKVLKDDAEDEEAERVENEEGNKQMKGYVSSNDDNDDNGKKRKKPAQVEENVDSVKMENGVGAKVNSNQLIKSVGFRQNGSRRKNKPMRAAEVGFECNFS
ncbi:hypothetical protein Leryth_019358 [Lithospermum erythrorhizon]|nr:hypothetical protein Leryth_019358 [Lithospermum erythrorhizon]